MANANTVTGRNGLVRNITAIVAAGTFALGLAGCDNTSANNNGNNGGVTQTEPSQEPTQDQDQSWRECTDEQLRNVETYLENHDWTVTSPARELEEDPGTYKVGARDPDGEDGTITGPCSGYTRL